jgi:FdhD protein
MTPISSIREIQVRRQRNGDFLTETDFLACEEPLEIRVNFENAPPSEDRSIYVTMRSPGNDDELSCGFLFSEGILKDRGQIFGLESIKNDGASILRIVLKKTNSPCLKRLDASERHFSGTSSCGVCGKTSLETLRMQMNPISEMKPACISSARLDGLASVLFTHQKAFQMSGGLHGCALFDFQGNLESIFEDVGRHNALDKLIGREFLNGRLPLSERILLVSGRASFELVQKSLAAKIPILAAIGAPSTLAVEMAENHNQTLVGFLGRGRVNLYSHAERVSV